MRWVDAAEVAHARERNVEQAVHELPHSLAAKGDLHADRHALAQLEVRNGLLRLADDGLLTRDLRDVGGDGIDRLRVVLRLAAPTLITILSSFGICITLL